MREHTILDVTRHEEENEKKKNLLMVKTLALMIVGSVFIGDD
jgi:hypothetical protein